MAHIFITEDDFLLRTNLSKALIEKGYTVTSAGSYAEAVSMCFDNSIDLYILDVMLPDGDGIKLCAEIRKKQLQPVILLTACDDEADIVRGLDNGADDYITKPFRIAELMSRVQAQLRRQSMLQGTNAKASGDLTLLLSEKKLIKNGKELPLRVTEFELLKLFMENPHILLKRELILERLWDSNENFVEDNTLSVHMSRLRDSLGSCEAGPYIETVRGIGYRWRLPVKNIIQY